MVYEIFVFNLRAWKFKRSTLSHGLPRMHTPLVHILGTWDGTNVARLIGSGISAFEALGLQWLVPCKCLRKCGGPVGNSSNVNKNAIKPRVYLVTKIHWGVVHLAFKLAKRFWARRTGDFDGDVGPYETSKSEMGRDYGISITSTLKRSLLAGEFFEVNEAQFPRRWCAKCTFLLWSSPL